MRLMLLAIRQGVFITCVTRFCCCCLKMRALEFYLIPRCQLCSRCICCRHREGTTHYNYAITFGKKIERISLLQHLVFSVAFFAERQHHPILLLLQNHPYKVSILLLRSSRICNPMAETIFLLLHRTEYVYLKQTPALILRRRCR